MKIGCDVSNIEEVKALLDRINNAMVEYVKGFRLGFVAIHLVSYTVDALLNHARKMSLEGEGKC